MRTNKKIEGVWFGFQLFVLNIPLFFSEKWRWTRETKKLPEKISRENEKNSENNGKKVVNYSSNNQF